MKKENEEKNEEEKMEKIEEKEIKNIRLYLLSGEMMDLCVEAQEFNEMTNAEQISVIKQIAEHRSIELGIHPPLRFHRLTLIENKEKEDKPFDYMAIMNAFRLECFSDDYTTITIKNIHQMLDATDWLREEESIEVAHFTFKYQINTSIKDGLVDELCKTISEKRSPIALTWDISPNRSNVFPDDVYLNYFFIDDTPLQYFTTVQHLLVNSKLSEDLIKVIHNSLFNVNHLTCRFHLSFRNWSSLLASTNIQTIDIEYSTLFAPYEKRLLLSNEFDKFISHLDRWAEWEPEIDNVSKKVATQRVIRDGVTVDVIRLQRYHISQYGEILDYNYL